METCCTSDQNPPRVVVPDDDDDDDDDDDEVFLVLFLHFRRKTRLIKWASVCVSVCLCTILVPP